MKVFKDNGKVPIKAWTDGVQLEDSALQQLKNLAALPFIHSHIAVMPDVHAGYGSTVGSVIPTRGAVIPAAVGVDIGCGMCAVRLPLTASQLPDNLFAVRSAIEAAVPHGRTDNGGANDRGAWGTEKPVPGLDELRRIFERHPKLERAQSRAGRHLGTLGTGNHFIELCLDEDQNVWVMLHSGSRGIGNAIGSYFIERAKEDMRRWFINLPDADLAYIPQGSDLFGDYLDAVQWAQNYALQNRAEMMTATLRAVATALGLPRDQLLHCQETAVQAHHNYVTWERHFGENILVTRKGAVRAGEGDLGIIPGSMGARSFIVRGKGNRDSFCSCSHGAGRVMSREEAKRRFTVLDHERATEGIECRKDKGVIDETPMAYKSIDAVMAAQSDLVEVVHTLRQVVCVKG